MATLARHGIGYREIEQATGIPSTTARRYSKRFPAFLPCRVVDRAARFKPEAVETFKRIHALYVEGKRTEEITAILAGELPQVHDVATPATEAATVATAGDPAALVAVVERLATAMERQAVALEAIAGRLAAIEAPERPIQAMEAKNDTKPQAKTEKPENRPWWRHWFGGGSGN